MKNNMCQTPSDNDHSLDLENLGEQGRTGVIKNDANPNFMQYYSREIPEKKKKHKITVAFALFDSPKKMGGI